MGKHTRIRTKAPRHRFTKGERLVAASGMLAIEAPAAPQYSRRASTAELALVAENGAPLPWWLTGADTVEVTA